MNEKKTKDERDNSLLTVELWVTYPEFGIPF